MAIETNNFGHLKNFLSELTSILLDKNIINNTDKARLDNQLRDWKNITTEFWYENHLFLRRALGCLKASGIYCTQWFLLCAVTSRI